MTTYAKLNDFRNVVILTGAGISVASGLRPFRGPGGLWTDSEGSQPLRAADLYTRPGAVWDFFRGMRNAVAVAHPNAAHRALAEAEATFAGKSFCVITQNIDGLHRAAGSANVVELHGSLDQVQCSKCSFASRDTSGELWSASAPTCRECGGLLRPGVVLFDEPIPVDAERAAKRALRDCDLFVAVGTSGTVSPASNFVRGAEYAGARTILVNLEPMSPSNPAFHEQYIGRAEEILPLMCS
jgi:NAD-dependent deacetylase